MPDDPILDALANCNPDHALEPGDPLFIDLDDIRDFALRHRLLREIQTAEKAGQYAKVAVAGHRGTGKSTELNRAEKELNDRGYKTIWASVNENLDPSDISFSDLIRLLIQLLDDSYGGMMASYPGILQAFETARAWLTEVTKSHSKEIADAKELGLRLGAGGKIGIEAGVGAKVRSDLGELLAAISIVRRSEGKERVEIKDTLERYTGELIGNVNAILRSIEIALDANLKLVFILDNIDKYDPDKVNTAILRHSSLLHALEAHLVFTIQSSLLHKPVESAVEDGFATLTIPMLPVFQPRTRDTNPVVMERLRQAVYLRVPPRLFTSGEAVDELITASGGCWRDLLRLLKEALLAADEIVGTREVLKARQSVAFFYKAKLRSNADIQTLITVHRSHNLLSDEISLFLLNHRCILAYNSEGWYDMHPLLDDYSPVKEALSKLP